VGSWSESKPWNIDSTNTASISLPVNGKSTLHIARVYTVRRPNFVCQHCWARDYWVSTVGKNEAAVRQYIQHQEKEDKRLEQLGLVAL
jgi:putative transposase